MPSEVRRQLACAIYTRKSTEHGLDQDFNSLDAQREAAEAFVKSQAHEGWRCLPDRFDDGGFSGGSLDRPALARLLAEIAAGRVQVVVVYKIDRLTRSLADFAKLVELFDRHGVSFVSVTQQFNTTTSMGRLTLNVLLSFAQFEREVIGERVRDKISASKKKGIWVGGPVPMGYVVKNKKPVIDVTIGRQVRWMFQRYLELGCLSALQREMADRGIRSLQRTRSDGRSCGGTPIGRGALAHILRNRFYIGEVAYKGNVYSGEQPALIDRQLFEAVQARLDENSVERRNATLMDRALLTGLLFDSRGNPMSPSHSTKQGVRYRYYVSQALIQGRKELAGTVSRASAPELEMQIVAALRRQALERGLATFEEDRQLVSSRVQRIVLLADHIELTRQDAEAVGDGGRAGGMAMLSIPWQRRNASRGELLETGDRRTISSQTRDGLLRAIARARGLVDTLARNPDLDLQAVAESEDISVRYLRLQLNLAFLSPEVVEAIAAGTADRSLTLTRLCSNLAHEWPKQKRLAA